MEKGIVAQGPGAVSFDIPMVYLKKKIEKNNMSKDMPHCHFLLIVI